MGEPERGDWPATDAPLDWRPRVLPQLLERGLPAAARISADVGDSRWERSDARFGEGWEAALQPGEGGLAPRRCAVHLQRAECRLSRGRASHRGEGCLSGLF